MDTQSTQTLTRMETAVAAAGTDAAKADALNALSAELMASDLRRASALARQAHDLAASSGNRAGVGRSLHHQGYCAYRLGEAGTAHALLAEGLALARDLGDELLEADCLHSAAIVHLATPDYAAALDFHLRALALYEKPDAFAGRAQTLNDIGNVYFVFDDHSRALSYYIKSLNGREACGDHRGVACSFNNIGIVYNALGNHEQALSDLLRCLDVTRQTGYTRLESRCLGNMAETYRDMGRFDEALTVIEQAVAFSRQHGYQDNEYVALSKWGDIYKANGDCARAVPLLQEALALVRRQSDGGGECDVLVSLGEVALGLDDMAAAGKAFAQAAEKGKAAGLKHSTFKALRGLSEIRERQGEYAAALALYKRFQALEKQVFNDTADRRTKALMVQMDVENAQQEADLQRRDAELHRLRNVELADANGRLEQQAMLLQEQAEELHAQAEELHAQAGELQRQATQDSLTGLANRRALEGTLARQFAQARQRGTPLSVVMADVDHFKSINDRFGHQTGDEVLMTVALLLRDSCGPSALIARYGGEEFALALPEQDAAQAETVCEHMRRAVEGYAWDALHPALSVTVSLGVAADTSVPNHERLLGLADEQLYRAKRGGRNCVCRAPACPIPLAA